MKKNKLASYIIIAGFITAISFSVYMALLMRNTKPIAPVARQKIKAANRTYSKLLNISKKETEAVVSSPAAQSDFYLTPTSMIKPTFTPTESFESHELAYASNNKSDNISLETSNRDNIELTQIITPTKMIPTLSVMQNNQSQTLNEALPEAGLPNVILAISVFSIILIFLGFVL